jgi:hypothetical protein
MPIARTHLVGLEAKDLAMDHSDVRSSLPADLAISANE